MATTTPKPESILADVATKLALITVANSFCTTVVTVNRQFMDPQTKSGANLPALAIFDESLKYDIHGIAQTPRQECELTFKIQAKFLAFRSNLGPIYSSSRTTPILSYNLRLSKGLTLWVYFKAAHFQKLKRGLLKT